MKKSLTVVPAFVLSTGAILVLFSLPYTFDVLAFAILCLLVASVLLLFSFVKFIITDEYISHPFIINIKKISWSKVEKVNISKSTISGYLYVTVSYSDDLSSNIIVGDWFQNKNMFLSEIKKNAIKAKIYE
jgi:hypothetical protein